MVAAWVIGAALLMALGAALSTHWRVQRDEARGEARDLRDELRVLRERLASGHVSATHDEQLRVSFAQLQSAIYHGTPIRYGEPNRAVVGRAWRTHFAECAARVDEYEKAIAHERAILAAYEARFGELLVSRGFDRPPYYLASIRNMMWNEIRCAVLGGEYTHLVWQRAAEGREFRVFSNTNDLYITEPIDEEEFPAIEANLNSSFEAGLKMADFMEFVRAHTARLDTEIAAFALLDEYKDAPIKRREECSQCQAH